MYEPSFDSLEAPCKSFSKRRNTMRLVIKFDTINGEFRYEDYCASPRECQERVKKVKETFTNVKSSYFSKGE